MSQFIHNNPHPLAGRTVRLVLKDGHPHIPDAANAVFRIEDWCDRVLGGSWMFAAGNPAAMMYGMRSGLSGAPCDDEVVYGKVGAYGHLIHVSELGEVINKEEPRE